MDGKRNRASAAHWLALVPALAAICFAASCYTSNYRREMRATVALMSQLSDKLADYCRAGFKLGGRAVTSEEMGEFYYALRKARAFEAMTQEQKASASRAAFVELTDAYERFLRAADQYRLSSTRPRAQLEALMEDHALVKQKARAVEEALGLGD